MDENKMRGEGKLQEIGGSIKETAGEVLGSERLETEGRGDKYEGQDRQDVARGIGQVKGAGEELKGSVKEGLGKLTGDDSTRLEGEADQLKGQARRELNS